MCTLFGDLHQQGYAKCKRSFRESLGRAIAYPGVVGPVSAAEEIISNMESGLIDEDVQSCVRQATSFLNAAQSQLSTLADSVEREEQSRRIEGARSALKNLCSGGMNNAVIDNSVKKLWDVLEKAFESRNRKIDCSRKLEQELLIADFHPQEMVSEDIKSVAPKGTSSLL